MVTKLVTLKPGMDVFEAIDLLLDHQISGAPVIDADDRFVGLFTEKDCLSIMVSAANRTLTTTSIDGFIKTETQSVDEETDLLTIAQIFLDTPYRRVPVLRGDKLVGLISRRDVLQACRQFRRESAGGD